MTKSNTVNLPQKNGFATQVRRQLIAIPVQNGNTGTEVHRPDVKDAAEKHLQKRTRSHDDFEDEESDAPLKKRKTLDTFSLESEEKIKDFDNLIASERLKWCTVDQTNHAIPSLMSEYAECSFRFWVSRQRYFTQLMSEKIVQKEIVPGMRELLMDWLIQVHNHFTLRSETLHLCAALLDRYLEVRQLPKRHLQLVGLTCLLMACKIEEIYPPEVDHLAQFVGSSPSDERSGASKAKDDMLAYEVDILNILQFDVCLPTGLRFLDRLATLASMTRSEKTVAQFLLELQMVDSHIVTGHSHLMRACASLYLSRRVLRMDVSWPETLRVLGNFYPEITLQNVKNCARSIIPLLEVLNNNSDNGNNNSNGENTGSNDNATTATEAENSSSNVQNVNNKKKPDVYGSIRKKYSHKDHGRVYHLFASI